MNYKAVIFDLDGTLIDSIEDIANTLNAILAKFNLPEHDIASYKRMVGNGLKTLVYDALPLEQRGTELEQKCIDEMYSTYESKCIINTKPYDGVVDLLDELDSNNITYSVLSNKADEFTKKIVATLFPERKFASIAGVIDELKKKPNPSTALEIGDKLGVKPEEILFVGDSAIDLQTGNNAGMHAVGVLWGFKEKEELEQNNAKYIIKHPSELIQIIRK